MSARASRDRHANVTEMNGMARSDHGPQEVARRDAVVKLAPVAVAVVRVGQDVVAERERRADRAVGHEHRVQHRREPDVQVVVLARGDFLVQLGPDDVEQRRQHDLEHGPERDRPDDDLVVAGRVPPPRVAEECDPVTNGGAWWTALARGDFNGNGGWSARKRMRSDGLRCSWFTPTHDVNE